MKLFLKNLYPDEIKRLLVGPFLLLSDYFPVHIWPGAGAGSFSG
jgi:hypothetical protein